MTQLIEPLDTSDEHAEVFDAWAPDIQSFLDDVEQSFSPARERPSLDPAVEDYGKIVGRSVGGIALGIGFIDTIRTGAMLAVQAAHAEDVEWTGIQLGKDIAVVVGSLVFLKVGVPALDRWWNKDKA